MANEGLRERNRRAVGRRSSVGVEALEGRRLLAVDVAMIGAIEGIPFSGQVATFERADVQGAPESWRAEILWGDGRTTAGAIAVLDPVAETFEVRGANTYRLGGMYPVIVTIAGTGGSTATGQGTANVADIEPIAGGTTIIPTAGRPFTGPVASFTDSYPGLGPGDYRATISWGDGRTSEGTVQANPAGGFVVVGSNTYRNPGTFSGMETGVKVRIVRILDGASVEAATTATVVSRSFALTGSIDPASDTGASDSDGITRINQPTFRGTAEPFAIVQVLLRPLGQSDLVPLGRTIVGKDGQWSITIGPLLDGVYEVFANVFATSTLPQQVLPLTPGGRLVIDTVGPRVVSLAPGLLPGQIVASLQDNLSGMDDATMADSGNYTLFGPHPRREFPARAALLPSAAALTTDPRFVAISMEPSMGRRFTIRGVRIVSGGVRDIAGNPLDGDFRGTYPSGDGNAGGSFVAQITPQARRPAFGAIGRRRQK